MTIPKEAQEAIKELQPLVDNWEFDSAVTFAIKTLIRTVEDQAAMLEKMAGDFQRIKTDIGNAIAAGAVNPQAAIHGRSGRADRYAAFSYDVSNEAITKYQAMKEGK